MNVPGDISLIGALVNGARPISPHVVLKDSGKGQSKQHTHP